MTVAANTGQASHDFDPDDPAGLADPEGLYGRLRERCPVAHCASYGGFWAVTRYRDVQQVMRDPATFSSANGIVIPRNPASGRRPPLHYDPPEHTAYRKVIGPVFRRERLGWLAPAVTALAESLVSALPAQVELYADFCSPYASRVVCLLLNIPDDLTEEFGVHVDAFEDAQRRRDLPVIETENQHLYGQCREVARRRAAQPLDPADDMLSTLLAAQVAGEPVTAEIAAGSLRQIVVAGHGAPALTLASAALHLARDAALQAALRADPGLVPPFVEEMLRLHTPNVGFARTTTRPARIGDRDIPAGAPVAVVLPAANQDPEIFGWPGELDLARRDRHLAFGDGPHVCPGAGPVGFDPLVSDTVRDPHALYRDMRAQCPVLHSDRYNGFWAITRYADVRRVLTESDTFITSVQNIVPKIAFTGRRPPLHLDPPEHTVYRTILNPLMSAARVAAVEPVVREYAATCLQPMLERGHGDFGTEFAGNFPVMSFARFLNVDNATMAQVQAHFLDFNKAIKDDEPDGMRAASLALYDLTRELIADRDAHPLDPRVDPATALLQARPGGEPLPRDLVVGTLRQVLLVGIVAPRFVLGSFAVHLAGDPDLQDRLRAGPSLIPDAVEELLRLYSPYRGFARTPTKDVEIGGCPIRKDEPIAMVFTSANRDEDVFPDPDVFKLGRPGRHIAFGLGPHHCPGANWARMELRVALEELLAATASFELAGPVEMTRWPEFGPESVPLRLHARETQHGRERR